MLRKVLGLLLLGVLSACTQPEGGCDSSDQCLLGATCERGICSFAGEAPAGTCEPTCAPHEACSARTQRCESRYSGLTLSPGDGALVGGGERAVEARLDVVSGFNANYPDTLVFTVSEGAGGPGISLTSVERNEGVYTARWTPSADGVFQVTAAYPGGGGPSQTVSLTVDGTGPVFEVTVPSREAGVADGGTTFTDSDPTYADAWRRDQIVPVEIRTNEPHLDPSQLKVSLRGTDGGLASTVDVVPFTGSCDAGFCGTAELKLWEPAFNTFRGSMPIVVDGRDTVGNVGSTNPADAKVAVTRWKWAFAAQPGIIRSTPAVGQTGYIYFGTTTGSDGKVVALGPDGYAQWSFPLGAVEGGIAVGANDAGTELVYVGARTSNGASLYALSGSNGSTFKKCPGANASDTFGAGTLIGGIGVGSLGTASAETAVSVYNGSGGSATDVNNIVGVDSTGKCYSTNAVSGDAIIAMVQDGPVAVRGSDLFYPSSSDLGLSVASYSFGSTTPRTAWPVSLPYPPRSLALAGSDVVASVANDFPLKGGVLKIPQAGGNSNPIFPGSTLDTRVYGLAIGSDDAAFFGAQSTSSFTVNRAPPSGTSRTETVAASVRASPVVGTNFAYFVSTGGVVNARVKDTLEPLWELSPGVGAVNSSPTLDCSRDASGVAIPGRPGVLYVPAGGKLHAFIVDSAGLDPNAKWPKYQHDARNTGNPDTVISPCP
ncbi:hypothetical protein MEBOL_002407 [Melittangium boletus DSM 14713]|uniref:Cell surface protein n=1 Tax=Melittangium boletus DSM 14713 TaxID=1294270 RepID=A0A250ICL9_9BACT|nr:hypothetical protein MEBOL_002407 [Melittangium boletus DSM 14713]